MHELSLCGAIADTALEHSGGRTVEQIRLRIGHFRQVVPETLQFCWDIRVEGTELDGCRLDIDHVPAVIHCAPCNLDTTLSAPVLRCGTCDGIDVTLTSGEEFLVVSIDVAPEPVSEEAP